MVRLLQKKRWRPLAEAIGKNDRFWLQRPKPHQRKKQRAYQRLASKVWEKTERKELTSLTELSTANGWNKRMLVRIISRWQELGLIHAAWLAAPRDPGGTEIEFNRELPFPFPLPQIVYVVSRAEYERRE